MTVIFWRTDNFRPWCLPENVSAPRSSERGAESRSFAWSGCRRAGLMVDPRDMRHFERANVWARLFLTMGALLPYWRLLTFNVVYVTDDYFTSDIFNGEFPGRVLVGQLIRRGELPLWTTQLCSGLPLAGAPMDPLGLLAFALLPPAAALDLFVVVLLLIAATVRTASRSERAPIEPARFWPDSRSPDLVTSPVSSNTWPSFRRLSGCRSGCC